MEKIWHRLVIATSTIPKAEDWQQVLIILLIYAAVALPIGFIFKFTKWQPLVASPLAILAIVGRSFVMPGIIEELLFRVLWIPQIAENSTQQNTFAWAAIALFAFVIYHPLNGVTFFQAGRETFKNSVFLILATFLGIACTVSYLQSGSVWTAVVIHGVIVAVWLVLLGGYQRLDAN